MNYPSAVNVARLPQPYVADHSQAAGILGDSFLKAAGMYKQGQNQKRANALADQLLHDPEAAKRQAEANDPHSGTDAVNTLNAMFPSERRKRYEAEFGGRELTQEQIDANRREKNALLQTEIVNAKEEQASMSLQAKAEQQRKVIRENTRLQQIMASPEDKKALVELMQRDKQLAGSVLDILKSDDAQAKQAMAAASADALQTYSNYQVLMQQHGKPVADEFALAKAREIYSETQDPHSVRHLMAMRSASGDEAMAIANTQSALAGATLKIPEVQKNIVLADGAQMYDSQGNLVAENEKDRSSQINSARSNSLREQELQLEREKFERGATKMSAASEKNLIDAQEKAEVSRTQAAELENVAASFENLDANSGASARVGESMKQFFGSEDAETNLRKQFNRIVTKEAIGNLPPGVASDKDVELVMDGYLKSTANSKTAASFLRGMAKIQRANEKYQSFKAEYISENGNTRGMRTAWKEQIKNDQESDPLGLFQ